MHGEEVPKGPVLKAVVVHEEAGGVQGAGQEEGPLEEGQGLGPPGGEAPALVEEDPGHQAGVVPVSLQGLGELGEVAPGRLGGEAEEARHLREDEEAEPVRQVEVAGSSTFWCLRTPLKPRALASAASRRRAARLGGARWPSGQSPWSRTSLGK